MLQTGEAQFAFPIPYEQAALLAKNSKLELVASPIMQRYISMNVTQNRSITRRARSHQPPLPSGAGKASPPARAVTAERGSC
ncbi:putative glutathione-binding protein GsiB [Enterobacter hormaechei subsp. xiangfangensis]|nr:putative glutathione-binding protein GsiB [Enterobacter hormaechei subsp. xiangfangensis]